MTSRAPEVAPGRVREEGAHAGQGRGGGLDHHAGHQALPSRTQHGQAPVPLPGGASDMVERRAVDGGGSRQRAADAGTRRIVSERRHAAQRIRLCDLVSPVVNVFFRPIRSRHPTRTGNCDWPRFLQLVRTQMNLDSQWKGLGTPSRLHERTIRMMPRLLWTDPMLLNAET